MDITSLVAIGAVIAVGAYLQTLTGFALGLIVMGLAVGLNLAPPATMAYLVSFLSGTNAFLSLRRHFHLIDKKLLLGMLIPALIVTPLGLWVTALLSNNFTSLLELLLGVGIIISALLLIATPKKQRDRSKRGSLVTAGAIAGISGGMFAAYGPPLVYMAFRQPLSVTVIRYTLQSIFLTTACCRLIIAGPSQLSSPELLWLLPMGLIIVLVTTQVARNHSHYWSDAVLRKVSLAILLLSGFSLCLHGF